MSATVLAKKVISVHYTLKDNAGDVLDTSDGEEPLVYLHGAGNVVPGLEKALDGKGVGDSFSAEVPPKDGYGDKAGPGPQPVPISAFGGSDVEPGMSLTVEDDEGNNLPLWVVEVKGDQVFVDSNHPLAGETLYFDLEVVAIRDATEQELAHGHVHTAGHDH